MNTKDEFISLLKDRGSCPDAVAWATQQSDIHALADYPVVEWGLILLNIAARQNCIPMPTLLATLTSIMTVVRPMISVATYQAATQAIAHAQGLSGYNPRLRTAMGLVYGAVQQAPTASDKVMAIIKATTSPAAIMDAIHGVESAST